jgi:AcrR family transcriptional regulator
MLGYHLAMSKRYLRARKPEQKEERRQHLLDVARELINKESDLNLLSLNEIARSAKMAKANIYRYFESREALLLDLLWDEWQDLFKDFQKDWSRASKSKRTFNHLIKTLAMSLSKRGLLCNLTTALPSVIEKNLSEQTIKDFKYRSIELFSEIANFLETCSGELNSKTYAIFLQDTVSLIAGIYPFLHPNDVVVKVLEDPDLQFFKRDFNVELERYMIAIANNHKSKSK